MMMTDYNEKMDQVATEYRKALSEWHEACKGHKAGTVSAIEYENAWQRYRLFNKQLEDNQIERAEP